MAEVPEVADELQTKLGQKLVAYATGINSPKLVGKWAAGNAGPSKDNEQRLRELFRTVLYLDQGGLGDASIRAWLQAENPDLNFIPPLDLLREGERASDVWHAAVAFVDEAE